MSGPLIGAVATVIVGLLSLLGVWWMKGVQERTQKTEERLSRYESWDRLFDNQAQEAERFKRQRDEAWASNDQLRAENARLRRRLEDWLSKGDTGDP